MCVCGDFMNGFFYIAHNLDISVLLLYVSAYIDVCYWLATCCNYKHPPIYCVYCPDSKATKYVGSF